MLYAVLGFFAGIIFIIVAVVLWGIISTHFINDENPYWDQEEEGE